MGSKWQAHIQLIVIILPKSPPCPPTFCEWTGLKFIPLFTPLHHSLYFLTPASYSHKIPIYYNDSLQGDESMSANSAFTLAPYLVLAPFSSVLEMQLFRVNTCQIKPNRSVLAQLKLPCKPSTTQFDTAPKPSINVFWSVKTRQLICACADSDHMKKWLVGQNRRL